MDECADRALSLAQEADALFGAGRLDAAEAAYRAAIALEATPGRLQNLASVRQLIGDYADAEALFRRTLELAPGYDRARASLGLVLLAQGRMGEGFSYYDTWRKLPEFATKAAPDFGVPHWIGEDVAGKNVVVWGEEGFGDQIMYARFARQLEADGARVGWVCHKALVRLVREGLGQAAIALAPELKIAGADFVAPTSRLPVVYMQKLAAPPPAPYLTGPKPNAVAGLSVGVVARGNPEHDNDRNRSLAPEAAAELMALPGAVSLAPEETGARDFWDTAAVIAGLELVITVDTSVAHLAGALGKPVWVLLPAIGTDWRWQAGADASPWYPSARLFRQRKPGDWSGVLAEVKAAFAAR